MHDIIYHFPSAAYLLFVIPLLFALFWVLFAYRQQKLDQYAPQMLVDKLINPRSTAKFWMKAILIALVWFFAVLALMQPMGYGKYPLETVQQNTIKPNRRKPPSQKITLLVDASASMSVADLASNKTRLEVAKEIADQIIGNLQGETVALYSFTSDLNQLAPSTLDYLYVRLMLRETKINEGGTPGTDFTEVLKELSQQYEEGSDAIGNTIVILSDGEDTKIESLKGTDRQGAMESLLNTIKFEDQPNFKLFTIGIGSRDGGIVPGILYEGKPVTSRMDEELLKALSKKGKGEYFNANGRSPYALAEEFTSQFKKAPETRAGTESQVTKAPDLIHDLYYQYPLGIAILLLMMFMITPETKRHAIHAKE